MNLPTFPIICTKFGGIARIRLDHVTRGLPWSLIITPPAYSPIPTRTIAIEVKGFTMVLFHLQAVALASDALRGLASYQNPASLRSAQRTASVTGHPSPKRTSRTIYTPSPPRLIAAPATWNPEPRIFLPYTSPVHRHQKRLSVASLLLVTWTLTPTTFDCDTSLARTPTNAHP